METENRTTVDEVYDALERAAKRIDWAKVTSHPQSVSKTKMFGVTFGGHTVLFRMDMDGRLQGQWSITDDFNAGQRRLIVQAIDGLR